MGKLIDLSKTHELLSWGVVLQLGELDTFWQPRPTQYGSYCLCTIVRLVPFPSHNCNVPDRKGSHCAFCTSSQVIVVVGGTVVVVAGWTDVVVVGWAVVVVVGWTVVVAVGWTVVVVVFWTVVVVVFWTIVVVVGWTVVVVVGWSVVVVVGWAVVVVVGWTVVVVVGWLMSHSSGAVSLFTHIKKSSV